MSEPEQVILPALRSDIQIAPGAPDSNGLPSWVVHDPLQHRYFHIDRLTRNILSIWQEGLAPENLIEIAERQLNISISKDHIENLLNFLRNNHLLDDAKQSNWRDYLQRETAQKQDISGKILKNYVFFKVPLLQPQNFLNSYSPLVAMFYSRIFVALIVLVGLAGLYLVSRQWDVFTNDIQRFFTFEGVTYFGLALIIVKLFHELGHAFTATRFKVQVPTMGVAFFLLTPLLYTDVSDAWRLSSRKQRLLISAAGIITELFIACLATLAWVFIPAGVVRDITLVLASTSWIMSLGINLNPLIKFDGYYLLSDLIGIDNLQQRSFALGKWKMRELFFAPGLQVPEKLSGKMQTGLIVFAWMTWVYRFILFTTIALLVYHFAFKLLGIFLLVLEVWILLAKPVIAETKEWIKLGSKAHSPKRVLLTLSIFMFAIGWFAIPRSSNIEIPAVFQAENISVVYPVTAAKIQSVEANQAGYVEKGAPLVVLNSPELNDRINAARSSLKLIKLRLASALVDRLNNEEMLVLNQSFGAEQTKLDGLVKEQKELVIRAPASGFIQEFNRDLHPGRWIEKTEYVAMITSPDAQIVKGYLAETSLTRLKGRAVGNFVPDDLTRSSFKVRFKNIAKSGAITIDIPDLASPNGGSVSAERNAENQLVPSQAQYLVELMPVKRENTPNQIVRGVVLIEGTPESAATRVWNQIAKVLIRETGF